MQVGTFINGGGATSELIAQAKKAARGSANILIEGMPGSGKTALAHFIHECAPNAGPIAPVYCAAGDDPVEALGTRSGASVTLILYDVAELGASSQAELAMALRSEPAAWIIAASTRDLSDAMSAGTFRADLFYQLAVVTLRVPPLAERPKDIPALARHFTAKFADVYGIPPRTLSDEALDRLAAYHWPGNVRELENVIQRAVLFAEGETVHARDINLSVQPAGENAPLSATLVGRTVADVERDLILQTLRHCGGNRTQAADILGISVRTLRNKIRQYHEEGAEVPAFSRAA